MLSKNIGNESICVYFFFFFQDYLGWIIDIYLYLFYKYELIDMI